MAPAKINLSLHVTERLRDGYHALDSLVAFSDIGDRIDIYEHDDFEFTIKGPRAESFSGRDKNETNLVFLAAHALAEAAEVRPHGHIVLTKNLPLASGIGGGSADAAATIKALLKLWNISPKEKFIAPLLEKLGADVPVCYYARPAHITGKGDFFTPVTLPENIPLVLVNPGKPCPTPDVFKNLQTLTENIIALPPCHELAQLAAYLKINRNDLLPPALKIVPQIEDVLHALASQPGSLTANMSGSGATCFGLFENSKQAADAAAALIKSHPSWWVKDGLLNPPC